MVKTAHQEQEQGWGRGSEEKVRNAVLDRLTEPAERQEYLRFQTFQRFIRENDAEEALNQWLEQQQQFEKEQIATQGLLTL